MLGHSVLTLWQTIFVWTHCFHDLVDLSLGAETFIGLAPFASLTKNNRMFRGWCIDQTISIKRKVCLLTNNKTGSRKSYKIPLSRRLIFWALTKIILKIWPDSLLVKKNVMGNAHEIKCNSNRFDTWNKVIDQ